MKRNQKNLVDLVLELEKVNARLDKIKKDPDYIKKKADQVFKDRPRRDYSSEINAIINSL